MRAIGLLFCAIPIFIIGMMIIGYGMRRFVALRRLQRVGLTTTGHILEVPANNDGLAASLTVVMFSTTNTTQQSVIKTSANVRVGDRVSVIYDPEAPTQAELLPIRPGVLLIGMEGLGLSFLCTAAFLLCLVAGILPILPEL
jgi:hypothetical protein